MNRLINDERNETKEKPFSRKELARFVHKVNSFKNGKFKKSNSYQTPFIIDQDIFSSIFDRIEVLFDQNNEYTISVFNKNKEYEEYNEFSTALKSIGSTNIPNLILIKMKSIYFDENGDPIYKEVHIQFDCGRLHYPDSSGNLTRRPNSIISLWVESSEKHWTDHAYTHVKSIIPVTYVPKYYRFLSIMSNNTFQNSLKTAVAIISVISIPLLFTYFTNFEDKHLEISGIIEDARNSHLNKEYLLYIIDILEVQNNNNTGLGKFIFAFALLGLLPILGIRYLSEILEYLSPRSGICIGIMGKKHSPNNVLKHLTQLIVFPILTSALVTFLFNHL